jgi:hypothetical protein
MYLDYILSSTQSWVLGEMTTLEQWPWQEYSTLLLAKVRVRPIHSAP